MYNFPSFTTPSFADKAITFSTPQGALRCVLLTLRKHSSFNFADLVLIETAFVDQIVIIAVCAWWRYGDGTTTATNLSASSESETGSSSSSSRSSSSSSGRSWSIRITTKEPATTITTPPTRYKADNARGDRNSTTTTHYSLHNPSSQRRREICFVETVKPRNQFKYHPQLLLTCSHELLLVLAGEWGTHIQRPKDIKTKPPPSTHAPTPTFYTTSSTENTPPWMCRTGNID